MQENDQENRTFRLIDEAVTSEPIKNTFRLGWEFISLNKKFTVTAVVIFILLNILGMIPAVAFIFMILSAIFGLALQIHIGKIFYLSENIQSYVSKIEDSSVEAILNRHTSTSFGAYFGWVLLLLGFLFILSILGGNMGLITPNMNETELFNLLLILGFPFIIIALLLSYVHPLVQSNIFMANGFREGFKAVFTIFSMDLWRLSMQKSYFKYLSLFGIVTLLFLFLFAFLIGIITTITGLALLGNILLMISMYVFMVMMAVGSMMARRVVENK